MSVKKDSLEPQFGTCFGLYLDKPVNARHFADVRQAGFDIVEVAANYNKHMRGTESEVELMKTAASENDIEIRSVHLGFDALSGDRQREIDGFVRRDLELAAELGAKILVAHLAVFAEPNRIIFKDGKHYPGFTVDRDLKEWPAMADNIREKLKKYVKWAQGYDVAFALETDLNNSHRLMEFVEPFDPESCGICFDTGHAQLDLGAAELAKFLAPRVIATHLHDNHGKGDEHLPPFQGCVEWERVIKALKASVYSGCWMFETLKGDLDDLKIARERILKIWNEC